MSEDATIPGRAVFLDKDGTLVEDLPYNVDPARVRLNPGAAEALASWAAAGYSLVVVSNQSGVARGFFPESALAAVRRRLDELLAPAGVALAGFYWCPHHPSGSVAEYAVACDCRKPAPGMIRRAARELGLDLKESWLVGDFLDDVESGLRAGCRTVLVDNGIESARACGVWRSPHFVATGLRDAARQILRADAARKGAQS